MRCKFLQALLLKVVGLAPDCYCRPSLRLCTDLNDPDS
jgi:hypothetical protein